MNDNMQLFTSYFAKLKKLPPDYIPVSICLKAPAGYKGFQYKRLAPTYEIFSNWKTNSDNASYSSKYQREILDHLTPLEVIKNLELLTRQTTKPIVLVCYEKPDDFCHRHLVADWFKEHGIPCEELTDKLLDEISSNHSIER